MSEKRQIKQNKHSSHLEMGPSEEKNRNPVQVKHKGSGRVVGGVTQLMMNYRHFAWINRDP